MEYRINHSLWPCIGEGEAVLEPAPSIPIVLKFSDKGMKEEQYARSGRGQKEARTHKDPLEAHLITDNAGMPKIRPGATSGKNSQDFGNWGFQISWQEQHIHCKPLQMSFVSFITLISISMECSEKPALRWTQY